MIVYVLLVYDMLPCNDKFVGMTCHAWKSLVGALVRVCLSLFWFFFLMVCVAVLPLSH